MFSAIALLNVVCILPVFHGETSFQSAFVKFGFRKHLFDLNLRNKFERKSTLECDNLAKHYSITQGDEDENLSTLDDKHLISLPKPLSSRNLLLSHIDGHKIRVAYHEGVQGEEAALKAYPKCKTIPCMDCEAAFKAVQCSKADVAVLPIENSIAGSIHRTYDLLQCHRLFIVGEVQLFGDNDDGVTRFLILAREPLMPGMDKPYKTSIVFALEDGPGVVFRALAAFSFRDIHICKIESRPQRNNAVRVSDCSDAGTAKYFEYLFYIDFEASMADIRAQHALAHLQEYAKFVRLLGCYPVDTSI